MGDLTIIEEKKIFVHCTIRKTVVTLGILIKIPPNLLIDLTPITFGRIKMFSKFIFLCLQNMVSDQQVEYIIVPLPSHPQSVNPCLGSEKIKADENYNFTLFLSITHHSLDPQLG